MNVYLRPLRESDALTSWHWRNNPEIWTYTGSIPDQYITEEIEIEWIRRVLKDETTKRFAICITDTDEYIGNVQLTNIENDAAQFHIFIGNQSYWGKGVSTLATNLLLAFVRSNLQLNKIYLYVSKENVAAIRSYEKNGFKIVSCRDKDIRMEVDMFSGND